MTYETSDFINSIINILIENYRQLPLDLESQSPECSLEKLTNHADDIKKDWFTPENNLHQFINGVTKMSTLR